MPKINLQEFSRPFQEGFLAFPNYINSYEENSKEFEEFKLGFKKATEETKCFGNISKKKKLEWYEYQILPKPFENCWGIYITYKIQGVQTNQHQRAEVEYFGIFKSPNLENIDNKPELNLSSLKNLHIEISKKHDITEFEKIVITFFSPLWLDQDPKNFK